jgi:hypothetical protein
MRRLYVGKPSPAMVVAFVALLVALSGTAVAQFGPFKGDTIIVKHSLSGNRLKGHTIGGAQVNLSALGKVPSASNADHASNADELGGVTASGYQDRSRWAEVLADGTVFAQSGGITVTHPHPGLYFLDFGSSVASHPISVTLENSPGGAPVAAACGGGPGGAVCSTVGGTDDTHHLFVGTPNPAGSSFVDHTFYVIVEAP